MVLYRQTEHRDQHADEVMDAPQEGSYQKPVGKDIIRDTLMEQADTTLMEATRIAELIRDRIEKGANVFDENPPNDYPPNKRG